MIALALGIVPCVPGFLGTLGYAEVEKWWVELYHYAWFISFGISAFAYLALMMLTAKLPRQTAH